MTNLILQMLVIKNFLNALKTDQAEFDKKFFKESELEEQLAK